MGIAFQPKWRVRDRLGLVADRVLASEPFNSNVFPRSDPSSPTRHVLYADNGNRLILSERDCILTMHLGDINLSKIETLGDNFDRFVACEMIDAGMSDIWRYGCVIRLTQSGSELTERPTARYLPDEPDARSLDLRFTRRLPALGAKLSQAAQDHVNLIYIVSESPEAEVQFAIDYQQYFEPELAGKQLKERTLELTRFRGYLTTWERSVHDGEDKGAVPG